MTMWNQLWLVPLTAGGSVVALFLLTKLMGNKQISQMSMFDYVVGISIGSIAAEMATELETPLHPLLAMSTYALLAYGISVAASKSIRFRHLAGGKPILLMKNGRLYRSNFKKARLDLSDFMTLCRVSGYFDLSEISVAIFEPNGTISFLPVSDRRPVQGADIALYPRQETVPFHVISDGKLLRQNLEAVGKSEAWLMSRLKRFGMQSYAEVFLATVDGEGNLCAFPMETPPTRWHPFE